jgi:chitin synthase
VFRVLPPEAESESTANQQFLETTIKVIKVIVYLMTFIIVLTAGVIAKGSILFMTSQLRPDKNIPYCNVDIGKNNSNASFKKNMLTKFRMENNCFKQLACE